MNDRSDIELVTAVLTYRDSLSSNEEQAFDEMHEQLANGDRKTLSARQRQWVASTLEKYEPTYSNDVSEGRIAPGAPVETPWMLRRENLPMRPPGRV